MWWLCCDFLFCFLALCFCYCHLSNFITNNYNTTRTVSATSTIRTTAASTAASIAAASIAAIRTLANSFGVFAPQSAPMRGQRPS